MLCYAVCCVAGEKRQEITAQRGQQAVLLPDHDRDRLEDMLRGLTAERAAIAEVRHGWPHVTRLLALSACHTRPAAELFESRLSRPN